MLGLRRNGACSASDAEVDESMSIHGMPSMADTSRSTLQWMLPCDVFFSVFVRVTKYLHHAHHGKVKLFALVVASAASIFQSLSRRRKERLPGIWWKQYMCAACLVGANSSWQREFFWEKIELFKNQEGDLWSSSRKPFALAGTVFRYNGAVMLDKTSNQSSCLHLNANGERMQRLICGVTMTSGLSWSNGDWQLMPCQGRHKVNQNIPKAWQKEKCMKVPLVEHISSSNWNAQASALALCVVPFAIVFMLLRDSWQLCQIYTTQWQRRGERLTKKDGWERLSNCDCRGVQPWHFLHQQGQTMSTHQRVPCWISTHVFCFFQTKIFCLFQMF